MNALNGKTIAFHTLGCKVNIYESEVMAQDAVRAGAVLVPFTEKAGIYVINTCSVTNIADRKSRQMIHRARKRADDAVIVVTGCYVETEEEARLYEDGADLILGNEGKKDFIFALENFLEKGISPAREEIGKVRGYRPETLLAMQAHTRADLKIQDGCNQFCTYCVIPYARGRIRSKAVSDVLSEYQGLYAAGIREFVLTGIHLSSYGLDFHEGEAVSDYRAQGENGEMLLSLIRRLYGLHEDVRIRLSSLEPRIITPDFAKALSGIPAVCPHFHLSLQSGSETVLRRMNRHYTPEEYEEAVRLLREAFDRPAITTDVICGFPGETEEEFRESLRFAEKIGFYEMHVFQYSRRKGTAADRMKDQVPPEVKKRRSDEMLALSEKMSARFRDSLVGRTVSVLTETPGRLPDGREGAFGYTKEYVRVFTEGIAETNRVIQGKLEKTGNYYVLKNKRKA